ncbi:hypothetical protein LOTGIDRAFT_171372 [Lottia gigantea]|uniref:Tyr recombinase domain-containing protein n=1 Tax=Lottia gigantea TaxID=225164 RepID=V4CM94_LOTGI|nr:hypothetical protein LOTGIDRAFT_171372 [Lottia gigantea]ESP03435.1 hypothetical protein LOTGIDRAFT_171372 [Lottia gigantea]
MGWDIAGWVGWWSAIGFGMKHNSHDIEELPEVLADKVILIPELLKSSRAMNTFKSYSLGFQRWKCWAVANNLRVEDTFPAKAFHFALYLVSLIQTANSPSPVSNAFYSVKWIHDLFNLNSPTDFLLVKNISESAKRRLSRPIVKKRPVTVQMLTDMYKRLFSFNNLKNQRIIALCLLSYAGFLRSVELLNIKRSDIVINDTYLAIFLETSKTDKYSDGSWILISKTGTMLCPPHVEDISQYCLHSLRSGGATAEANKGLADRLFKRHGRWVSECAKDGYMKDALSEMLSVSLNLGL